MKRAGRRACQNQRGRLLSHEYGRTRVQLIRDKIYVLVNALLLGMLFYSLLEMYYFS